MSSDSDEQKQRRRFGGLQCTRRTYFALISTVQNPQSKRGNRFLLNNSGEIGFYIQEYCSRNIR